MIDIQVNGLEQAAQSYARLRDGVDRAAYISMEGTAEFIAHQMAQASPIGNYDDEPGHQPVPRNPGELAGSWHVEALNQYSVAVVSSVWYAKLMLFPDAEKDSWVIAPRSGGSEGRGGIGNQRQDIMRNYSPENYGKLLFQGRMDGMNVLISQVTREKQKPNEDMIAVLQGADATAQSLTRNLFGQALQDYVRIR
jgi:hypothetical protein